MDTYKADMGLGFTPTFSNLFLSVSVCFTLLCLFGACLNFYLRRKKPGLEILRGVILINLVIFGICFVVMAIFTFLPPILSTGLIFVALIITYISLRTTPQTS
jgi:putative copper export protein